MSLMGSLGFASRAARSEQLVTMASAKTLGPRIERILAEEAPSESGRHKVWLLLAALLPLIGVAGGFRAVAARTHEEAVASAAGNVVLPKSDPARPLSQPVYPPASRRSGEHGTVVLKLHVLEDGSVADAVIAQSSGYPDLDYAAFYESFRWRLDPGTIDGMPSRMWGRFAVTLKLTPRLMRRNLLVLLASSIALAACGGTPRRVESSGGYPLHDCPQELDDQVKLQVEARPIELQAARVRENSIATTGSVGRRVAISIIPAGLRTDDRVVWSTLTVASYGGTFLGWDTLQTGAGVTSP